MPSSVTKSRRACNKTIPIRNDFLRTAMENLFLTSGRKISLRLNMFFVVRSALTSPRCGKRNARKASPVIPASCLAHPCCIALSILPAGLSLGRSKSQ